MRCVVQRVAWATVTVSGRVVGEIGSGLLAFVGVEAGDGLADARTLADKLVHLRVFADEEGRMNRSAADAGGAVLAVSQFTLHGDVRKGRRPSFTAAADPDEAEPLVAGLVEAIRAAGIRCETGVFGAHMDVDLRNDGPVTLILEVRHGKVV